MTDNDDYMAAKTEGDVVTELMWDRLQEGINANRRFRIKGIAGGDSIYYNSTKVVWSSAIYIYFTRESDGAWVYNTIAANPSTGITCDDDDLLYVTLNDTSGTTLTVSSADYTAMPTDDTGRILILGAIKDSKWYGIITPTTPKFDDLGVLDDIVIGGSLFLSEFIQIGSNTQFPSSGSGLELLYYTTESRGIIQAYDRDSPGYLDLGIFGDTIIIEPATKLVIDTGNENAPFYVSRSGYTNQSLKMTLDDHNIIFDCIQDDDQGSSHTVLWDTDEAETPDSWDYEWRINTDLHFKIDHDEVNCYKILNLSDDLSFGDHAGSNKEIQINTQSSGSTTNSFYFSMDVPSGTFSGVCLWGFRIDGAYSILFRATGDGAGGVSDRYIEIYDDTKPYADGTFDLGSSSRRFSEIHGKEINGEHLIIDDGISAPSSSTGKAKIYIDSADGDLKIVFGDGTIKTIVTDT